MKRLFKEIFMFGLAVILGGAFFIKPLQTAAMERIIINGDTGTITALDPAASLTTGTKTCSRNIYQGLLRFKFNTTSELEGDLAESWSVSKDGLVYTFKLRDNIKWHKGFGKVTAYDVKFSFDRIMDPKTQSVFIGELGKTVKEVKVIDDLTVEIHLRNRDAAFLYKCARPQPVSILCKKAVEEYGKDHARNPIGSGPFVFQSMTREQVVLTANKDYYEGPPKFDKLIFKVVPDMDTMILALKKGEIDATWLFPRDRALVDQMKAAGCNVKVVDKGIFLRIHMNPKMKPFADIRVRRAIAHAIDKDEIVKHVFSGYADRWDSLVPKGYFGHTEEGLRRYDYDPKKAKGLLAEAGYPNGFEVTCVIVNSPTSVGPSTAIQSTLAEVGIKMKLDVMDNLSHLKMVSSGQAEMTIMPGSYGPDADVVLTSLFHTAGFSPGLNLFQYNKLDREIDEARSELDKTKRLKIYHEIQKRLMEDLPVIPLAMVHYPAAYRPHITGIPERDPVYGFDYYHIHSVEGK